MKALIRILSLLIIVAIMAVSCNKSVQTATKITDSKLKYNFALNQEYKYSSATIMDQLMTFGGQEIAVGAESYMDYTVTGLGKDGAKFSIKIRVDSLSQSASSMQGQMNSNPKEIIGKEFQMSVSELGKESDLEEAELIEFMAIGDQPTNMKATFLIMFADIPDAALKIGYTWTQSDTVDMSTAGQSAQMIIHSNNTVAARENFNGYDCFKITSTNTGERTSSGDTPQGFISTSGKLVGTGILYFAITEGMIVSEENIQKFDGEVSIPTGESIPMYMDIKITNELKK